MFTENERGYESHRLRNFWTDRWIHQSLFAWENVLREGNKYPTSREKKQCELVVDALKKLMLEKQLTKNEAERLWQMLKSPDGENIHVALCIIKIKKPKKFLKNG